MKQTGRICNPVSLAKSFTPPGLIVGGGYFVLDALGVFHKPDAVTPFQPDYAIPDNTYVSPIITPNLW